MSTVSNSSSPANDTRRKQSKRDEVSTFTTRIGRRCVVVLAPRSKSWLVAGSLWPEFGILNPLWPALSEPLAPHLGGDQQYYKSAKDRRDGTPWALASMLNPSLDILGLDPLAKVGKRVT